jgi:molecular chaperone DnaJ
VTDRANHYATLGIQPDATATEIRDAYRRLARRHHPDRGDADDAAAMPRINEAYRVLSDPGRRALYDAAIREAPSRAATTTVPSPSPRLRVVVDDTPARIPWKLMLGMAGVGATIVLVGAALYEPPGPERPDNLLQPGSCVTIESNGDAREVTCTGDDQLVVEALVPAGERCPDETAGHRDRQGLGLACVRSVP